MIRRHYEHHLVLTDDAVRTFDTNVKMSPPLRAERDRVALLDALRDGTIEAVATDHAPHARHEKDARDRSQQEPQGLTDVSSNLLGKWLDHDSQVNCQIIDSGGSLLDSV